MLQLVQLRERAPRDGCVLTDAYFLAGLQAQAELDQVLFPGQEVQAPVASAAGVENADASHPDADAGSVAAAAGAENADASDPDSDAGRDASPELDGGAPVAAAAGVQNADASHPDAEAGRVALPELDGEAAVAAGAVQQPAQDPVSTGGAVLQPMANAPAPVATNVCTVSAGTGVL